MPVPAPVIVLDAAKLAKSGILTPNTFNTGKLSWDIHSETVRQTFVIRYTVDTSRPDAMTMKLEYFIQLHGKESAEINYKVPLRRGISAGEDAWGFVCPSTKKIVSRLILHPGDRYFIGDLRSIVKLEQPYS